MDFYDSQYERVYGITLSKQAKLILSDYRYREVSIKLVLC